MEYIELHTRSAFSFLRGAATPEELIAVCSELKMPAMALLDTDGVYGAARFHLAGKKLKVKAHIGAELTVSSLKSQVSSLKSQPRRQSPEFQIPNFKFQIHKQLITLPLLVRNRTGYQNLCRLITLMKLRVPKHSKPGECAVTWDELAEYAEGLVCLTGNNDGPIAGNNWRTRRQNGDPRCACRRSPGSDQHAGRMWHYRHFELRADCPARP